MKAIGIKINIQNYDANTFFGTNLPNGTYQIAEFAWVSTPFVSGNQSIYCSYTNTTNCGENWTHYANPQVDKLMKEGSQATSSQPRDQPTSTRPTPSSGRTWPRCPSTRSRSTSPGPTS